MTISPKDEYGGQVDISDANYPYGKARNDTSLDSGDGTPLEQLWVNDLFGTIQHLLDAAGITPNATPDSRSASQIASAIRELTRRPSCSFDVSASGGIADDGAMALSLKSGLSTSVSPDPVFSVTGGNTIVVPDLTRWYLLLFKADFTSSSASNPKVSNIDIGSSNPFQLTGYRWSTNTNHFFPIVGARLHHPGLWGNLQVINRSSSTLFGAGELTVVGIAKSSLVDLIAW